MWIFRKPLVVLLAAGMVSSLVWPASAREQFAAAVAHDMCKPPHSCPTVTPANGAPAQLQALTGGYTPTSWAQALLGALGDQASDANLHAVTAWERAEGGHWSNAARFNPLNTTQTAPGSWPINSVGVQAFPSWGEGFTATVQTLRNGRYGGILAALADGSCAACVAAAVASSPWGTGAFA
jgi:hypothetical protein